MYVVRLPAAAAGEILGRQGKMKDFDGKQDQDRRDREPEELKQDQDRRDQEPEELYPDRDLEGGEDDWEDELEPSSGWLRVLFIMGLTLLIVVLSAGIWYITHPGGKNEEHTISNDGTQDSESAPEPSSEDSADPSGEPGEVPTEEPSSELPMEEEPGENPDSEEDAGKESDNQVQPDSDTGAHQETPGDVSMTFTENNTEVTPKDVVNLRSVPDTTDAGNIVAQAVNGEILLRSGINYDTGWSRIDYKGQTVYAVSQYLTTDLNYQAPAVSSDPNRVKTGDGRTIIFVNCDDWISPKEYVNLRKEPSTTEGDATVSCQLNYGEKAHRTGYSPDSGWSRVEYNGEILYVVTSLIYEVTEETTD